MLAALAVLLGATAVWELAGARAEQVASGSRRVVSRFSAGRVGSLRDAALRLGLPARLQAAGLTDRVSLPAVFIAKLLAAVCGGLVAASVAPAAPGRVALLVAAVLPAAGFFAPDALLERQARRRRRLILASLPDALDLLSVGAAAGRDPGTVLAEIARESAGPLAGELGIVAAEIEAGASLAGALASLRERIPGHELGALSAALERSRRYGSPLAAQLSDQAATLRSDARRSTEEHASRAAPKIQLVVALVLVPSVLLMIAAGLIANSEAIFAGF